MRARDASLAVIDFESTGSVPGYPHEPWQLGMVRMEGGRLVPDSFFESLLHVGDRPFNPHAPGRHGECRAALAAAPRLVELWPTVRERLAGDGAVAHNVSTERTFLHAAAPLHRVACWIDTLPLYRFLYPGRPRYALEDMTAWIGAEPRLAELLPGRTYHDALFDAAACALLLEHALALPAWRDVTLETLSALRVPGRGSRN